MISTRIISEVVGSPEEHVNKTMDLLLDKIKEQKTTRINNEKKFDAQKMENSPLFSGFIEYEAEFNKIEDIIGFCFDFMPSSIEIIDPPHVTLSTSASTDFFNELLARLHQNDMFLRNALIELRQLKESLLKK